MESHRAQQSMDIIHGAPSLSLRPSLAELIAGVLSIVGVLAGSAALIIAEPPRTVGVPAAIVLLAVNIAWWTHKRPGQVSRSWLDHAAQFVSLGTMTIPASMLIWPPHNESPTGSLIAGTAAAVGLAVFIALRWRP